MRPEVSQLADPRQGHFDLGTGFHGDLWLDLDVMFLRPGLLRPLVQQLAHQIRPYRAAAVCGPLAGGAFLALMVAETLGAAFVPAFPDAEAPGRFRLPAAGREQVRGRPVAIIDDAVNAATAVQASCQAIRDAGGLPAAVAALLALGRAATVVATTLGLPFHALESLPSEVWPAGNCPLCNSGIALGQATA